MNEIHSISGDNQPADELEREEVQSAVVALYGLDRGPAKHLAKACRYLTAASDWSVESERFQPKGVAVRYANGTLRDVLSHPGDLALIRVREGGFKLLQRTAGCWRALDKHGEPQSREPGLDGNEPVEAVLMSLPEAESSTAGFTSLAALWPKLRAAWAEVGIASLFINSGQLLLPIFALLIYDKIALNGLFETLWALVFGMALYLATDLAMRLVRSWTTERISVDQTLRNDEKLWSELVAQADLPPGGFPRFLSNYRDLTLARDFVSSNYLLSIADIPFLALYLAVIGFISWPLMVAALVLLLVFAAVGGVLYSRQTRLARDAEQKNTQKLTFMGETLGALDVIRTTPGAGLFLRTWREVAEETTRSETRRRLALHQMGMLSTLMQTVTTVVILTCGVYLIHAQLLSIGKLIACNLLAGRAMALVASLFAVIGKWQDFKRAAARMEKSIAPISATSTTPHPEITGEIAVIGLGKTYEDRPPALEDISCKIEPGERVALLGRPGAGKSTLLRCLAGLCRPDSGQVLIDGLAMEDIDRLDRVRWLVYKAQDPAVFAGTLEENLRIAGCRDRQRLNQALWAAGLEQEFRSGRMTLGMRLAERGSNLSGGQRQKVALARAFAQPSRILLLDEPTLGLDPESERLLAARLPELIDTETVLLMTTHSPIMLETVKRIIVLDNGRLAADGPREKLVTLPQKNVAGG